MAKKRKTNNSGGANWMNTYCDLVTLLLIFFILLYAMSTIDAQKYADIVASFSKQMNPEVYYKQGPPADTDEATQVPGALDNNNADELDELYTLLQQYVDQNELGNQVQLNRSEEYVFIRFSDSVTFRGYSDILEPSGRAILDVLAGGLKAVDEYIEEVIIAGHTAAVEYDKTDIDRSLSTDRANVVLKYLEDKNVIDPSKYLAIGYGLYSPIADNSTPEGRAKNRRVEIYISRQGYPISYTKIIQDALNHKDTNTEDIEYKTNTYIE